jgi:hypothetical protein
MKQTFRKTVIYLSLISLLFHSGCTVISYKAGKKIDVKNPYVDREYILPDADVTLFLNEKAFVRLKTDEEFSGRIIKLDHYDEKRYDLVLDVVDGIKILKYEDIKLLQIIKIPTDKRAIYGLTGAVIDYALITILLGGVDGFFDRLLERLIFGD